MGSVLGGLKAGVISGIVYAGGIALANVLLLLIFKQDALNLIQQNYSTQCSGIGVEGCFYSVLEVYVPVNIVTGYILILVFSSIYGMFFEYIPGSSYASKGITISTITLVALVYLGSVVLQFVYLARVIVLVVSFILTIFFGLLLGRFYRRYTRWVEFISDEPNKLKIIVDGRDMTGKRRTFSLNSIHKVRAEGSVPFKSWAVSGGVSVDDSRSYETSIEIKGDGVLKVSGRST